MGARINPGFVCVGPERTETSWLYLALSGHPEIAMPPVKEIRYFYDCAAYPGETLLQRFSAAGDWHCREYRAYVAERLASYRHNPLQRQLFWDLKYLFGCRSIRWYRALFDRDKIAGDISPQYFSMPDSQLERMARHLGGVKVLILLRDPIEWSWSFARMSLIKDRACVPDRELEEPRRFLDEVCDFIGVSRRAPVPAPVNVGGGPPLPAETLSYLRALWLPEIERLCEVYALSANMAGAAPLRVNTIRLAALASSRDRGSDLHHQANSPPELW